ncbi:proline-rich protein 15-like protein [Tachysurus fulvidraco]|uniref:proline-rich protein 15-like protein n=1 Tax=Tachysurus fulvidraco TaxID=1234273 RepID=UPI001FF07728|nr:proline-rich protein 15-like protein [Tachysurus fulvidraco]
MAERIPWWKAFTGRVLSNILKDAAVQQDQGSDSKTSGFQSDGFDASQLEPALIENTFSRNLSVSRSGRYKEKRKVRATLPTNKNLYESNTAVAK